MGVQFQLQMSWQPSQKRKTCPPLGLKNLGNSCYLNSVLQCLTYTPPLANFCLRNQHSSLCDCKDKERKRECPFCMLERRIVRSLSVDLSLDAPAKIWSCLHIFAEHFRHGWQEDAHEFLRYVIDACHNTCLLHNITSNGHANGNGHSNGVTSTVVMEIFGGALQSQVKCQSCGTEYNKVDEIMDISLDVLQEQEQGQLNYESDEHLRSSPPPRSPPPFIIYQRKNRQAPPSPRSPSPPRSPPPIIAPLNFGHGAPGDGPGAHDDGLNAPGNGLDAHHGAHDEPGAHDDGFGEEYGDGDDDDDEVTLRELRSQITVKGVRKRKSRVCYNEAR